MPKSATDPENREPSSDEEEVNSYETETDPENVREATPEEAKRIRDAVDETYDLQDVSLKLPAEVIKTFDQLADDRKIGPRALMQQVLREYADESSE